VTKPCSAWCVSGIEGYVTNLQACPEGTPVTPEFVIGACHRLYDSSHMLRSLGGRVRCHGGRAGVGRRHWSDCVGGGE
jgi:hypothetical protein